MLAIEFEEKSEVVTNVSFDDSSSESEKEMSVSTPAREELRKKRDREGSSVSFGNISGISGVGAKHDLSSSEGELLEDVGNEVKKPRFASENHGDRSESEEDIGILAEDGTMGGAVKLLELHEEVPPGDPGPACGGKQSPLGGTQ